MVGEGEGLGVWGGGSEAKDWAVAEKGNEWKTSLFVFYTSKHVFYTNGGVGLGGRGNDATGQVGAGVGCIYRRILLFVVKYVHPQCKPNYLWINNVFWNLFDNLVQTTIR